MDDPAQDPGVEDADFEKIWTELVEAQRRVQAAVLLVPTNRWDEVIHTPAPARPCADRRGDRRTRRRP